MDENFYYLFLAIPATCLFWWLYVTVVTALANWLTCRRLRNHKVVRSPDAGVSRVSPQKKPQTKVIRGFDSPELFSDDTLKRIRELHRRIAEYDKEIESWKRRV